MKTIVVPLAVLAAVFLSGCNIVRGVGEDMAASGRTLAKISGTESKQQHENASPAAQPFDQSYEDQTYVEPTPLTQ